jgi:hypothetical protein
MTENEAMTRKQFFVLRFEEDCMYIAAGFVFPDYPGNTGEAQALEIMESMKKKQPQHRFVLTQTLADTNGMEWLDDRK